MEMTLSELAQRLGGELSGDGGALIRGVAPLESAGPAEVSFLTNDKYKRYMTQTNAAAVIVSSDYDGPGPCLIRCQDAYFAFREAMVVLHGFRQPEFDGIDERAAVDPSATIAKGVRIAPFVTVASGAAIGENTTLYPGVYVGPDVRIGRDCTLYAGVTIYDGCILGDRVIIHANTSIGQDGFGYATHDGRHEKIPQAGSVELADDVEIGACCSIDRASLGATVIGAGTKLSNNVTIGHGTKLGRHCLMVAQSGIAGSTLVGDYCVFAAQSGVVGHIRLGDGVRVGAQSGVVKDVEAGAEVMGSPHFPAPRMRRIYATFSKLPEMRQTLKKLSRQVGELLGGRKPGGPAKGSH